MIEYIGPTNINERGPLKKIADRYLNTQLDKEREKLRKDKQWREENMTLATLMDIRKQNSIIMQQNAEQLVLLQKLTNGPNGDVHYIELVNYAKNFGEVFIDFIRGDKNSRSRLPPNTEATFPYSHVFMIKITNDGVADISFQTNRHARMIKLKAGESDIVSENENFELTELRISNATNNLANVRIVLYA